MPRVRAAARPAFTRQNGLLTCAGIPLERLAKKFGTPLYVYDLATIERAYREFADAFVQWPHLVCASVKANGNLSILGKLREWGSGFDIVSAGELARVLRVGGDPGKVVFSGVGKTAAEIDAALDARILLFNVESQPELLMLEDRARRKRVRARFGVRVNPDVTADTHPHIATGLHRHKFGVELQQALGLYAHGRKSRWLEAAGISFHIGSQILDTSPFGEAVEKVASVVRELRGHGDPVRYFDIGGGLGISYRAEQNPPGVRDYALSVMHSLEALECTILMEPGRRLFAAAAALLTRVTYVKQNAGKTFVITDAGYNDLIRPVLYAAYHEIVPVQARRGSAKVDVVGPICETADAFALDREMPVVKQEDLLAIMDAGAYGFSIASNYNSRPRPAEVLIERGRAKLIRRRETIDDLMTEELVAAARS